MVRSYRIWVRSDTEGVESFDRREYRVTIYLIEGWLYNTGVKKPSQPKEIQETYVTHLDRPSGSNETRIEIGSPVSARDTWKWVDLALLSCSDFLEERKKTVERPVLAAGKVVPGIILGTGSSVPRQKVQPARATQHLSSEHIFMLVTPCHDRECIRASPRDSHLTAGDTGLRNRKEVPVKFGITSGNADICFTVMRRQQVIVWITSECTDLAYQWVALWDDRLQPQLLRPVARDYPPIYSVLWMSMRSLTTRTICVPRSQYKTCCPSTYMRNVKDSNVRRYNALKTAYRQLSSQT